MASGHYVAITRSGGAFTRFSDGEVFRIESADEAWVSIDREPVVILFGKRAPDPVGGELVSAAPPENAPPSPVDAEFPEERRGPILAIEAAGGPLAVAMSLSPDRSGGWEGGALPLSL